MAGRYQLVVRRAGEADAAAMCELSIEAITRSAAGSYDERQRAAWAARRTPLGHRWMVRETTAFVAEDVAAQEIAGFATVALTPVAALQAGEVDQLFVAPRHGGRGAALLLLDAVATAAAAAGLPELLTHASWRAVPVFERAGYRRVTEEAVDVDGVTLTRALMRRPLGR